MSTLDFRKLLFLSFLLPFLFFFRAISFDFMQLDDSTHLDFNPFLKPISISNTTQVWTKPHAGLYAPLTYSVWAVVARFTEKPPTALSPTGIVTEFRFHPAAFHFLNILLHAVSSALFFATLCLLLKNPTVAFLGAMLFALHPVQVEPVAWVSSLKDTLSGFFMLLSFWAYCRWETSAQKMFYRLMMTSALLALLSKPSTVVFPLGIWLVGVMAFRQSPGASAKKLAPLFIVSAVLGVVTSMVQSKAPLHFVVPELWQRPFVALDAIGFYLGKLLFPDPLLLDYGRTPSQALSSIQILLTLSAAATLILTLWRWRKKEEFRFEVLGILFALIMLLPVLGFIPFFHQTTSTVTNRYLYLAMPGIALAIAALLSKYQSKKWVVNAGVLLLLGASVQSQIQLSRWKDGITLLSYNVEKRPASWLARNNLGAAYERKGDTKKALEQYRIAADLYPSPLTYNNVGALALFSGDLAIAIEAFEKGIAIAPEEPVNYQGLATAWRKANRADRARETVERGLRLSSGAPMLQQMLRQIDEGQRAIASQKSK